MKVSLNWLKKYTDLPKKLDPNDFGLKLTLATVEVEEVISLAQELQEVYVGKVLKISEHPNADKLKLVEVDLEKEKVSVVCGGTNLSEGMMVALAKVGACVRWHGQGDLVKLEPAKIRGVESQGMICAANEIGLDELFPASEPTQILDLTTAKLKVGMSLASALKLDDYIYDIDNKSLTNRPDLWGHYGLAREAAAIYETKLREYEVEKIKEGKDEKLAVENQAPELCSRYLGIIIDNVKVEPSPEWLKKSLQTIGLKSINNIVDVTNYLLFDLGQPMHAFSANVIKKNKIVVRRAHKGEKLVTLDEQAHKLEEDDLVIADDGKAVALAGIMGGKNSQITNDTTKIILESATFEPYTIRRTSERVGLRTEASMRFEKSLDPQIAMLAIQKAVELILELCPEAKVVSNLIDDYQVPVKPIEIETSFDFINNRIGQDLSTTYIKDVLQRLGFELKIKGKNIKVLVPSWRATKDVSIQEDLVEEVARLYGYDNLQPKMPVISLDLMPINKLRDLERTVKQLLIGAGCATEVFNYSFVRKDYLEKLNFNPNENIELINPVSQEESLLRKSLIPNLLNNVAQNLRFEKEINIFECGNVFINEPGVNEVLPKSGVYLPHQPLMLSGVITSENDADVFYQAKALLELILTQLEIKYAEVSNKSAFNFAHPHRMWAAEIDKKEFVFVGEFHPKVLMENDINQKVAFWQIDLSQLSEVYQKKYNYKPVAKFPAVQLDLSIVLDEKVLWKDIETLVFGIAPKLIKKVELFDIFKGDKIGVGLKSLAFHIFYQDEEKTLEMKEIQKLHEKVIEQLQKALNAQIRK